MSTTQAFADRVASVACDSCGKGVDVSDFEPLSTTSCPFCRASIIVPGVVGTLVLKKLLGRGTAGIVYHAFDHSLEKDVAVKVFLRSGAGPTPGSTQAVDVVEKCLTEARAMRALTHPNIVQIYKVAQKGERPFIVMELLTGSRLDQIIESHLLVEEHRALRMAIDVASGLKAVHDAGFAHLDVKPANIQMDGDGVCKLMDYDTARSQRQIEEQGAGLVGTPYYVAPEIIRRAAVDFRADMYSLGATLFHLMAQRPPFQGDTPRDVVQERLKRKAINLHDIRQDVSIATAAVIAKMLEPEPGDRYANYDLLLADLRKAQEQAVERALRAQGMNANRGGGSAARPLSQAAIAGFAGAAAVIIALLVWLLVKSPAESDDKSRPIASGTPGQTKDASNTKDSQKDRAMPPVKVADGGVKDGGAVKTPVEVPSVTIRPIEKINPVEPPEVKPVLPAPPVPPVDDTKKPDAKKTDPEKTGPVTVRNEKEVDGWQAGKEVTLTVKPGLLTVWATGGEPSIRITGLKGPGNGADPSMLEIRLRASGEGAGKLWWLSERFPLFSDTRNKAIDLKHDGEWHDYLIAIPAKGDSLELKIDLGTAAGIFEIQSIKFFANAASDTRPTRQWRFEER